MEPKDAVLQLRHVLPTLQNLVRFFVVLILLFLMPLNFLDVDNAHLNSNSPHSSHIINRFLADCEPEKELFSSCAFVPNEMLSDRNNRGTSGKGNCYITREEFDILRNEGKHEL